MPHLSTPDFIEKVIEEEETEILTPADFERIIDKYAYQVNSERARQVFKELFEEHVFPELRERIKEEVRLYWQEEEQKPDYYRKKVEDFIDLVFSDYEREWTIREIAEELDISESYAYYLRWLVRRAGFEV